MKKFLSLVLALAMTLSLVTISAGAKDFADDDSIDYKEAVDVISAIGIVNGYPDGSFGPDGALTRGAAAKIICNLILGPTTASALRATTAPFKDVPTTNVFAGYITYCAQQGIISGYGDGTFRPTGALSGNAFMKMLLGALGYSSSKEGYTGANWQINVIKQAVNIGLGDGNDEFVGSNAVTRQEAALYAFNMLQADLVEYPDDTIITSGDVTVTTQGTFKSVQWGSSADADGNIDGERNGDGYVQFAERYFNRLVKTAGTTDDFNRPATKWTWKGSTVGTYAETADVVYSDDVKLGQIYADLGMTEKDETAEVYVDGAVADDYANVSRGNDLKVSEIDFNGVNDCDVGKGTRIEAFRNANTNEVTIVCINYYPAEVNRVVDATASKDAYITLNDFGGPATGSDEFETEGFDNDQIVYYTYADGDIQSVEAAEFVEGTLTRKVAGKKITLGENDAIDFSNQYAVMQVDGGDSQMTTNSEYVVYLDPTGNAIYVEESEYNIADYAFLRGLQGSGNVFQDDKAAVLTYDAKFKTLDTDKDYTVSTEIGSYGVNVTPGSNGKIVLTRETSDGEYRLKDIGADDFEVKANDTVDFEMRNGKAKIEKGGSASDSLYADSKSVIVVGRYDSGDGEDANDAVYTAYTGASSMPDIARNNTADSGDTAIGANYYCRSGDVITIMFITVDEEYYDITGGNNEVIYFAAESASKLVESVDNDYYELNGVIAGKIVEGIKVSAKVYDTILDLDGGVGSDKVFEGTYTNVAYEDGIITNIDLDTKSDTLKGINKLSNENIVVGYNTVNEETYVVDDDVKVFFIDDDGDITEGTIGDVRRSTDDIVTYVLNSDDQISHLFIQQYFENNNRPGGSAPASLGRLTVDEDSNGELEITAYQSDKTTLMASGTKLTVTVSAIVDGVKIDLGEYDITLDASGKDSIPVEVENGWKYTVQCGKIVGNHTGA